MEHDKKLAVLIDADNVSMRYIKQILDETSNHGMPTYKRIYGDWTSTQMTSWKSVLLEYSITPIQQYSYTSGKNATDSALIIDAMDILYSGHVDGFCIISSDSDFTRLASRLREAGMLVIGMGEKKTPKAFVSACERFLYLENLATNSQSTPVAKPQVQPEQTTLSKEMRQLVRSIYAVLDDISNEDGWAGLGAVGSILGKRQPDFDTRNYGYTKLLPLITATGAFLIQKKSNTSSVHGNQYYIKRKNG